MNDLATGAVSVLQGAIQLGTERVEYRTSFSSELRFRCLPDCGLCCRTYRIALTGFDLDRLKQIVNPEACPTIALTPGAEGIRAFMENGKGRGCCYLGENARCSVYDHRPLYCRTYPLIRDVYEQLEMSVDYSCPGVGEGDPVGRQQIEEAFALEARNRPDASKVMASSANHRIICGSLKAMGVHTDARLIRAVCAELVRRGMTFRRVFRISAYFTAAAAALAEILAGHGNITDPEAAARIVEGVDDRLDSGSAETQNLQNSELTDAAADTLADYLAEWSRRQALLRFVHATALARPRKANVLYSFFSFLVHGACQTMSCAEQLRRQEGEQSITARLMREAIRKNEGPLRSRCASVVSTY
jgi:Fe-S-cluster containining protein